MYACLHLRKLPQAPNFFPRTIPLLHLSTISQPTSFHRSKQFISHPKEMQIKPPLPLRLGLLPQRNPSHQHVPRSSRKTHTRRHQHYTPPSTIRTTRSIHRNNAFTALGVWRYTRPSSSSSSAVVVVGQRNLFSSMGRLEDGLEEGQSGGGSGRGADEIVEEITELYGTARDEFEIAAEETEKNTTYAADDRAACREELDKLLAFYKEVQEEGGHEKLVKEEVRRRVGGRIRELEGAVLGLEGSVLHGD